MPSNVSFSGAIELLERDHVEARRQGPLERDRVDQGILRELAEAPREGGVALDRVDLHVARVEAALARGPALRLPEDTRRALARRLDGDERGGTPEPLGDELRLARDLVADEPRPLLAVEPGAGHSARLEVRLRGREIPGLALRLHARFGVGELGREPLELPQRRARVALHGADRLEEHVAREHLARPADRDLHVRRGLVARRRPALALLRSLAKEREIVRLEEPPRQRRFCNCRTIQSIQ